MPEDTLNRLMRDFAQAGLQVTCSGDGQIQFTSNSLEQSDAFGEVMGQFLLREFQKTGAVATFSGDPGTGKSSLANAIVKVWLGQEMPSTGLRAANYWREAEHGARSVAWLDLRGIFFERLYRGRAAPEITPGRLLVIEHPDDCCGMGQALDYRGRAVLALDVTAEGKEVECSGPWEGVARYTGPRKFTVTLGPSLMKAAA